MIDLTNPAQRKQYYPSIASHAEARRILIANAVVSIRSLMEGYSLTPLEWLLVFADLQKRVLHPAVENEWIGEATKSKK